MPVCPSTPRGKSNWICKCALKCNRVSGSLNLGSSFDTGRKSPKLLRNATCWSIPVTPVGTLVMSMLIPCKSNFSPQVPATIGLWRVPPCLCLLAHNGAGSTCTGSLVCVVRSLELFKNSAPECVILGVIHRCSCARSSSACMLCNRTPKACGTLSETNL